MTKHLVRTLVPSARMLACKTIGFGLILAALSRATYAGSVGAPEIDASSFVTALTLLSGGILVITNRARRK